GRKSIGATDVIGIERAQLSGVWHVETKRLHCHGFVINAVLYDPAAQLHGSGLESLDSVAAVGVHKQTSRGERDRVLVKRTFKLSLRSEKLVREGSAPVGGRSQDPHEGGGLAIDLDDGVLMTNRDDKSVTLLVEHDGIAVTPVDGVAIDAPPGAQRAMSDPAR